MFLLIFIENSDKQKIQKRVLTALEVIDKTDEDSDTTTNDNTEEEVVQFFLLKNKRSIHDKEAYPLIQSIVIQNSFYTILGDKLKDYPQVTHKTPLISLQFFEQLIDSETRIYALAGNQTMQLTEMKALRKGYIYMMIVYKNDNFDGYLTPMHIKFGIDIYNNPAIWKHTIRVDNPNEVFYMNIGNLPFEDNEVENCTYTLYYVAYDENISPLAINSGVKSLEFTMWNVTEDTGSFLEICSFLTIITILSIFLWN